MTQPLLIKICFEWWNYVLFAISRIAFDALAALDAIDAALAAVSAALAAALSFAAALRSAAAA